MERSTEMEWIDLGPAAFQVDEYRACLKMLFRINKFLGIYRATVNNLRRLTSCKSLVDVGCGGGLFLLHLQKKFPHMKMTGIDHAKDAIALANAEKNRYQANNVFFDCVDLAKQLPKADVILATLVCHHLTDNQLVSFLREAHQQSDQAVIINDLHRHPLACYLYRFIAPILFPNRLVIHDGLISIKRSFTRKDWQSYLAQANIKTYRIQWQFPFWWRVIIWKT